MPNDQSALPGLRPLDHRYTIAVIDGPNVSNLARRNKRMYGPHVSAEGLGEFAREWGARLGVEIERFMSNHEATSSSTFTSRAIASTATSSTRPA